MGKKKKELKLDDLGSFILWVLMFCTTKNQRFYLFEGRVVFPSNLNQIMYLQAKLEDSLHTKKVLPKEVKEIQISLLKQVLYSGTGYSIRLNFFLYRTQESIT